MSFYEALSRYKGITGAFGAMSADSVGKALFASVPCADDLAALLSSAASSRLEEMAARSHEITLRHFGRTIQLYTPLYLSNYCENRCAYCGFNSANKIPRKKLTLEEVEKEARFIGATGLKHILVLTGESRAMSPLSYIKESISILKKYFSSVSVEIYALNETEYRELISAGVDGLTIYQETYDEEVYDKVHPAGPKRDYRFRLDAPARGAAAGMRNVNIGTLLGLNDWRAEAFWLGLHAKYLQDRFPDVDIGVSLPRLKPHAGAFTPACEVGDKALAQVIMALRIFLPRAGISLSTREAPKLRENLIPLGITRMSAGSSTYVGGRTASIKSAGEEPQFEISDKRDVAEMMAVLEKRGYQPVLKDWF
ncbi:MAG: 2-iminoacetate synthase ThiH [Candidatus Omnitrophica bacterium]|nr:2-iminoacetate synthase ThiH [Candidatus Omnitrophota bacterium]